jgi:hypothetical protein
MKLKTYTVTWEIDVEATTPKVAAERAFFHMQEPGTTATCFLVKEFDGSKKAVMVDLLDNPK